MKLVILASHPVQYHAPVFRGISQQLVAAGHECLVVYLSDFSIQGYCDQGFGQTFAWDEPLLAGYRSVILNQNSTTQPQGFFNLKAPNWQELLKAEKPTRLLVTTLNYQGACSGVLTARLQGIPCTLRAETTDESVVRTKVKEIGRYLIYSCFYKLFDSAIAFGSLNQQHLIKHGFQPQQLGLAYFSVPDRFKSIDLVKKQQIRQQLRQQLGFSEQQTIILFSGKLIPKKNPELLLSAITKIPEHLHKQIGLIFLGSGILETKLQKLAADLPNLKINFAGFKNQQELPPYYLAADLLVLPSHRQGEVWGLVVNEALQAGLPCIITNAVGCAPDFGNFPDFQIIPENDAHALAQAIVNMLHQHRDFERYNLLIKQFSVEETSRQIVSFLLQKDHKINNKV